MFDLGEEKLMIKNVNMLDSYFSSACSTLMLISVKVKFILDIINKKLIVNNRSKKEIREQLISKKYPQMIEYCFGKGLVSALIMRKYKTLKSKQVADFICEECYKDKILLMNTLLILNSTTFM